MKNPEWNTKLIKDITAEDYKYVRLFYKYFLIRLDPQVKALIRSLELGKPITLDDQRLITRTLLGDIAKQNHIAFISLNKLCKGLAKECAAMLAAATK